MRDPIGPLVPGADITIFSGNQFRGPGNAANQLQDGSSMLFRRPTAEAVWTEIPMRFRSEQGNNKYYAATIFADTTATFTDDERFEYYLRITYSDRDSTFVHADGQGGSATAGEEVAAQAAPFSATMSSAAEFGVWGPVLAFPNAAIHTSVQPDGRVLMWGRRDDPQEGMDPQHCTPFVWDPLRPTVPDDPRTARTTFTGQPRRVDGSPANIFCAGHAFLPDGRLLVAGGHLKDSDGINAAVVYDAAAGDAGTWSAVAQMAGRRWYPTASTAPDGSIVVLDGSYIDDAGQTLHVSVPEVWTDGAWREFDEFPDKVLDLYPRVHIVSDGRAFVSGPLEQTWFLELVSGHWHNSRAPRKLRQRDYAPAVLYDTDKILYIGGGGGDGPPTNQTERIDLTQQPLAWKPAGAMHFARRQHNATVLPDGTVLVTGGTRGGGFNDLDAGQPVHTAELWDPDTGAWTALAAESVDRCYHATAVLLPDATVLSAGGGEFKLPGGVENDPSDTHHNAQIFRPPYLFRDGNRPQISHAPTTVEYGSTFTVQTADASDITKVTLLRLAAVTHSFDQSQHISFLEFQAAATTLTVTAPATPNVCPPGFHMLFILNSAGIPSVASIVRIGQTLPVLEAEGVHHGTFAVASPQPARHRRGGVGDYAARAAADVKKATGTAVLVAITAACPYGLGACWGGAREALAALDGVELVNPVPNTEDSTAQVFLRNAGLPDLSSWSRQFRAAVSGRYALRGFEVTVDGEVQHQDGRLVLSASAVRAAVTLLPLTPTDKLQWSHTTHTPKPLQASEASAYQRLADEHRQSSPPHRLTVTGPLVQTRRGYELHVRVVERSQTA